MQIENIISKGYFPKELPPPFNTEELANKYNSIKESISGTIIKDATRSIDFSIVKVGHVRKNIKIPNPIHQCSLFELIVDNWTEIETSFASSKFSVSKPILKGERAANIPKFKEFTKKIFLNSYPYKYELKTDISKYYPSIYTHSIPWALHGKDIAKRKPLDKSLLGNKLDAALRQTMYGQTIGIPIGPDSSVIISEIIGAKIDQAILKAIPELEGYRYVDDMHFFFHTYAEAETCLIKLQQILKEFELQINSEKTKIRKIPVGIEPAWVIQLRSFTFRETDIQQYNDIISFFSLAFDLAIQLPNEYVLSYAIQKIKRIGLLSDNNFKLLETMLLKTMVAEPSTIKEVFRILYTYNSKVDILKIEKVILDFIKYHCERGNDYELAWALWIAKTYKIKISKPITELLLTCQNSICIIIILDLKDSGLIEESLLDISAWEDKLNDQSLIDENWLLAYEMSVKKWICKDFSYIDKKFFFKILQKNRISFYDPEKQILPLDLNVKEILGDSETEYDFSNETINENQFVLFDEKIINADEENNLDEEDNYNYYEDEDDYSFY